MTPATKRLHRIHATFVATALAFVPALASAQAPTAAQARVDSRASGPGDPEAVLREARAAVEEQRYREGLAKARSVRDAAGTSARLRAQALEITAVVHLIEGRTGSARAPLAELYTLAPAFILHDPALPPRVTDAFDAEARLPHARSVQITMLPRGDRDDAIELTAGGATAKILLECRPGGSGEFVAHVGTRSGERYRFQLPAPSERPTERAPSLSPLSPRVHQCVATAVDADELPLGRLGSSAEPFEVRAPAPPARPSPAAAPPVQSSGLASRTPQAAPARPITSAWWFWAALTALMAAGVTATVVATRPGEPTVPAAAVTATAKAAVWTW